jgi:predicted phosphodiesterase
VISAIGNHDDENDGYGPFKKYVVQDEISFADRNSYFIVINNIIGDIGDEQLKQIENELIRSSDYKHRFIFMHKPPLSPYQQSWYRPELSPWSYKFMKMCEKYKVDIVFTGHEHMYKEKRFGGVKYITCGGGGGMILHPSGEAGGFFHYLVVRVYGDYVDYEVRRVSPPVWEFFAYYIWKDLFYFFKDLF